LIERIKEGGKAMKKEREYLVLHFDGSRTDGKKYLYREAEKIRKEHMAKTGELLVLWPVLSDDYPAND
jgi:hypothetical protein